ncbi:hypothetical protein [Cyanobium sp. CH-040]|uniref:hypothetical protein n=1 Tax=Cyanobium sp. CH-040 TaxID=2823708 RepID=UPI0020CEAB77|nr:hypothetical protein [Cyanobium sp. CH-040]MCP9928626.1 hypothetical protein [Cyanobium sp. CH-040]
MGRVVRWGLGLLLLGGLLLAGLVLLPLGEWLPGGTVADVPTAHVVNGTAFNRLFPPAGPGEQLVFTQEKRGFSEARLKQGDATLALLAISDTATAPEARDKFSASDDRIQGWPVVEQGPQASALLVAERFQVKVIGQGAGLDVSQRHELLDAFDLKGLAALQAPALPRRQADRGPALQPVPQPAFPSAAEAA